jgi:alginate O-acetyltransferase complex protein AlgI
MIFSEANFWLFFAIVFGLYLVFSHRWQNRMLLVASYVFYGAWDWRFLGLIFLSTGVDYLIALKMDREMVQQRRKMLLMVSLVGNLGMLAIFKYLGFFVTSFAELLTHIGLSSDPVILSIVLPVGISFYTFQTLSYTIDVYRRELPAERNLVDFALFVAFFPQLVAGPIERATQLLPRIVNPRQITWDGLSRGAVLCLVGLIKKIVIADGVAASVNAVYANPSPSGLDVLVGTWLFAIQIYCDFSGYTDIARGISKMLGFDLMRNFAQPYLAVNPQEFWHRWHISLSTWLRDYLYISLGGNRHGRWKTYRNLMLTMLLGGLWHGAAWNFVLWGAYQGGLLSVHRTLSGRQDHCEGARRSLGDWMWRFVKIVLFFQVVCYGWLLFRAQSFAQIRDFTLRLFDISAPGWSDLTVAPVPQAAMAGIMLLFVWDMCIEVTGKNRFYEAMPPPARAMMWSAMLYFLAFGLTTTTSAFIYFQF